MWEFMAVIFADFNDWWDFELGFLGIFGISCWLNGVVDGCGCCGCLVGRGGSRTAPTGSRTEKGWCCGLVD